MFVCIIYDSRNIGQNYWKKDLIEIGRDIDQEGFIRIIENID